VDDRGLHRIDGAIAAHRLAVRGELLDHVVAVGLAAARFSQFDAAALTATGINMPALVSAPSKKSFSSVSSPILACRAFKSTAGARAAGSLPKTPAAPSRSWPFHW
jgi:hypothetical protein